MSRIFQYINSYDPLEVLIELAVIWGCVYLIFRFLRGTRGAGVVKGLLVILVLCTILIRVVGQGLDSFRQLNFIYERFLGFLAILLIVVFQPELRQAMIRLGHALYFRGERRQVGHVVHAISKSVRFLCKSQFGAIIAIERGVKLGGLVEGGQELDALVSERLLENIFWPNSPLHDLGVVIRGDRIAAASVQFPLVEEGVLPPNLGSRHRAGVGLTMETDAIVVIVSEETGTVSIAEHGKIDLDIPLDVFEAELARRLETPTIPVEPVEEKTPASLENEESPTKTSPSKSSDDKEAA
ncbi:MAG: diadenylate cyclase [Planctomycetota bacterium]|nr:diadenylate cyclase [Planctomycetota bacterium]